MEARKCGKCRKHKALTRENWKAQFRGGGLSVLANCRDCLERDKARRRERETGADPEKENVSVDASADALKADADDDDASDFFGVDPISLDAFRNALEAAGDVNVFCARVDMSALPAEDLRAAADALAEIVWEKIGYRFLYHSTRQAKNSDDCRYTYHCAQLASRRHSSTKNPDPAKQRDKGQMDMFECGGWVNIWATPDESDCFIRIRHLDCHQQYVCIDVPDDVKRFIADNPKLRAPQLWKEILKTHPRPTFAQKAVYNQWFKQQQSSYRRCDDEFESAKILLQEFADDPAHELVSIPMPESDGFRALGFVFPSVLRQWNGVIREVALDSTFQTNKAGFECFALLGEVGGSGVPLGFILLKSNKPEANEKEQYIRAAIRFITVVWKIHVKQVLSDKDMTEINGLLAELPDDVKYQLCFWHCIRAVKTRLSVLGRHPAHYDAVAAFNEFDWIHQDFLPLNQLPEELRTEEHLMVAQTAIPTLKLRLTGQTSEVPAPPRPTIHLNGRLEHVDSEASGDSNDALQSFVDSLDDDEEDLDEDPDAVDRWDGPASIFEPGETAFATTATYVFCPSPHRKQILRMFIRHFCEHPLLPDHAGSTRNSAKIRYDAVWEMYQFCFQRGLREVWAYMWTAWYCPTKFRLWVRSSDASFIGRWRTTMSVENFWRNLKHETLHHFVHPRLDQLIYLIAVEVLPATEAKMQIFEAGFRPGRPRPLTPFRKAFKKCWKMLALRPLGTQVYIINLVAWTCSCGQQKYNAFLLCKHLVQAVLPPPPDFFREVVRRRVTPFYSHRHLRPKDGSELNVVDSGSVSDGDDVDDVEPAAHASSSPRGTKRKRALPALAAPSPPHTPARGSGSGADPYLLSSSPVIADEAEDDSAVEWTNKRIIDIEAGLAILKTQASHPREAKIFLNSMKANNIGGDLVAMATDVRRLTETGTVRRTTWAQKGKKPSARFTRNTQGVYIP